MSAEYDIHIFHDGQESYHSHLSNATMQSDWWIPEDEHMPSSPGQVGDGGCVFH
jgi:hypothetical protein